MSAPSTSGLSVGLLLRVIDVKYGCLLYFYFKRKRYRSVRAAPRLISDVLNAWSGKQTEIHRNAPGSQFCQEKKRAQQNVEMLLKYHRLGNNLHPNHWGKGRQNSDGRASIGGPPKRMYNG